jgi:catechol 2,3-dioxygenase
MVRSTSAPPADWSPDLRDLNVGRAKGRSQASVPSKNPLGSCLCPSLFLKPISPPHSMNIEQLKNSRNGRAAHARFHSSTAVDHHAKPSLGPELAKRKEARHEPAACRLRLGHVHIRVRDLSRSVRFYVYLLGLRLTEQVGRFAFLSAGDEHHSIALEEIGDWTAQPPRGALGVAHVAFEAPDRTAFNAMRSKLREMKMPFISGDNGTNWALNLKDPDGNQIQIILDRRHSPGGAALWRGHWYGPLQSEKQSAASRPPISAKRCPSLISQPEESIVPARRKGTEAIDSLGGNFQLTLSRASSLYDFSFTAFSINRPALSSATGQPIGGISPKLLRGEASWLRLPEASPRATRDGIASVLPLPFLARSRGNYS